MLMSMELKAYAKLNLGIDVTGRRDDGYHLVRMVMQSVDIYDTLILTPRDDNKLSFSCTDKTLMTDDNLCIKAAGLLREHTGDDRGIHIELIKRNPVAAGMAGGSTDAAAVLRGMSELLELDITEEELFDIALKVGADVPFCIHGGTALCEGIGEILTPISGMPDIRVLVARPAVQVSTAGIYGKLDRMGEFDHPDIDGLKDSIEKGDVPGMCRCMGNVLEPVTSAEVDEISVIESVMTEHGAKKAMMTGSGPTVFGVFLNDEDALRCQNRLNSMEICSFLKMTDMIDRY